VTDEVSTRMNFIIPSFRSLVLAVCCLVLADPLLANDAPKNKKVPQSDGSLELLMAGNARFVSGRVIRPDQSPTRRKEVARGQTPFAIILTCADSRVSPEIYFDQGLGNLFVIRNSGNLINPHVIGSMEYAVDQLHAPLIIVVGHERCGAVSAAVTGGQAPGQMQSIIDTIAPAVVAVRGQEGDPVENAVVAHAQLTAAAIRASNPILAEAVAAGKLKVVAARYDLETGQVVILPETVALATKAKKPVAAEAPEPAAPAAAVPHDATAPEKSHDAPAPAHEH
jgi:carbonic anhydrase